jgi:hypothetical protein
MTHEQFGRWRREALPWSAIVAAIAFGWSAVGQLVSVRDDLVANCHAIDVRITNAEQWQRMHDATDERFRDQVMDLVQSMHGIREELKAMNRQP